MATSPIYVEFPVREWRARGSSDSLRLQIPSGRVHRAHEGPVTSLRRPVPLIQKLRRPAAAWRRYWGSLPLAVGPTLRQYGPGGEAAELAEDRLMHDLESSFAMTWSAGNCEPLMNLDWRFRPRASSRGPGLLLPCRVANLPPGRFGLASLGDIARLVFHRLFTPFQADLRSVCRAINPARCAATFAIPSNRLKACREQKHSSRTLRTVAIDVFCFP